MKGYRMQRFCNCFVRSALLTVVLIMARIVCACALWHPADDRAANTGMFVVSQDVLIDPDSIAVDYEDENIRRTSLCIFNIDSKNIVLSYARMHFLEDKELADVYYSRDGAHYEEVRFEISEDMANRAYHWMLAWIGSWEQDKDKMMEALNHE